MPKATINGVGINYESDGEGFPVVLCYCRGGNATMWNPQVEAFSKNYRFIRFEPRGHGKSDAPQDPSAYGQDTSVEDLLGCWTTWASRRPTSAGSPWAEASPRDSRCCTRTGWRA